MAILTYATPATIPIRYFRLALGSAALAAAALILLISVLFLTKLLASYFPSASFLAALCPLLLANSLILAAVVAFASVQNDSHLKRILCLTGAVLHVIIPAANYIYADWAYGPTPHIVPLYARISSFSLLFDQALLSAFLIAALIFLRQLRKVPLATLAMVGLIPAFLFSILDLLSGSFFWLTLKYAPSLSKFLNFSKITDTLAPYNYLLLLLFWLTLMILALIFNAKSRHAGSSA